MMAQSKGQLRQSKQPLAVPSKPAHDGTPDKSKRRANVLKDGSRTVIGQRKRSQSISSTTTPSPAVASTNVLPSTTSLPTPPKSSKRPPRRKLQIARRPRSNSNGGSGSGSESDNDNNDDMYPEPVTQAKQSAFTDRLALSVPQKRIPKRVTREAVVDTVFTALFAPRHRGFHAPNDDNTGSESDTSTPNETFVKRGLAATLFKDGVRLNLDTKHTSPLDQYITPTLIHSVLSHLALVDATSLRLQYVQSVHAYAYATGKELKGLSMTSTTSSSSSSFDHGHSWTEFLRYAIEHVAMAGESASILTNYARSWVHLCKCHYLDTHGTDSDDLLGVAGQFVAYVPHMAWDLIRRLLVHGWPVRVPSQQIFAIRALARLMMAAPRLSGPARDATLPLVFRRLAQCMAAPHVAVAKEALAFAGCQFVLVHFVQGSTDLYAVVSSAFYKASTLHWHDSIRTLAATHFDDVLDFAP
ncbi:hypothetical protein B5M09_002548 [Aphanomyces astaci]|uniref:Uncharacterized protein n=1 Tax=Aphanomyces astaci TaxID=112090 RepID=A0A3R8DHH0_APHAT|nr:hypothetical protein B5M09_002548 [Aphanomyces astaci]